MDLDPRALEKALDAYAVGSDRFPDDMARAIRAYLSASGSGSVVRVKPLDWVDKSIALMHYIAECDDDGRWRYSISGDPDGRGPYKLKRYGVDCGDYPSIEAAKASGQSDFDLRTRSLLLPALPTEVSPHG